MSSYWFWPKNGIEITDIFQLNMKGVNKMLILKPDAQNINLSISQYLCKWLTPENIAIIFTNFTWNQHQKSCLTYFHEFFLNQIYGKLQNSISRFFPWNQIQGKLQRKLQESISRFFPWKQFQAKLSNLISRIFPRNQIQGKLERFLDFFRKNNFKLYDISYQPER